MELFMELSGREHPRRGAQKDNLLAGLVFDAAFSVIGAGYTEAMEPDGQARFDGAMSELASRLYVRMLDAGIRKCEKDGRALTDEQQFGLLTAGQLPIGDWRTPPGADPWSR
jgi:hypothetical protein